MSSTLKWNMGQPLNSVLSSEFLSVLSWQITERTTGPREKGVRAWTAASWDTHPASSHPGEHTLSSGVSSSSGNLHRTIHMSQTPVLWFASQRGGRSFLSGQRLSQHCDLNQQSPRSYEDRGPRRKYGTTPYFPFKLILHKNSLLVVL